MANLKVRFALNKGRRGAPLSKLGKIAEQAEKFLRALAADSDVETRPGEWLAVNFQNGSVEYDAEFQGNVTAADQQIFSRNLELLADFDPENEGLNVPIKPATVLEYARIGSLIDPDETINIGIYPAHGRAKPRWRTITYSKTATIRKLVETPLPSYGSIQGILHAWFKEAKQPHFQIRELGTDALVRCYYPPALYSDVVQAVEERTTVLMISGSMLFDRATHAAIELRADRIERMRMLSGAEFEQFFGSAPDFTGGLSTEDYLDSLNEDA